MLVFFAAWLIVVVAAPFTLPSGSVHDLSGVVGKVDNWPQIEKMNPFAATINLLGDVNCHQIKERSFFLNGNEMPFCSRDTGIFIGLVIGMLIALLLAPRFSWIALIILVTPIVLDGGLQMVSSYQSTNALRLITGIVGGTGASYFLARMTDVSLTVNKNNASPE